MRNSGGRGRRSDRRGALLLEVLLALAIFISAGLAILTAVERAVASLAMVRDLQHASDLARSALAKLEAGIAEPETISGPVPPWEEGVEGFDDAPPAASGWELIIETAPSPFDGLTLVTVTAHRSAETGASGDDKAASYTLRQLVRLVGRVEDAAGDEGTLLDAAAEGARRAQPPPPRGEDGP